MNKSFAILWIAVTPLAYPAEGQSDPERAKTVLHASLGQAPIQAKKDHSWLVRWSALQRSAPDSQGLKTAVELLADPALVIRMQAVHWIAAYGRALFRRNASLPEEATLALWHQLTLQSNFQSSGNPLAVAHAALATLRQNAYFDSLEQKKAKDRILKLRSLAEKTSSKRWRAELLSLAQELSLPSSKPRQ